MALIANWPQGDKTENEQKNKLAMRTFDINNTVELSKRRINNPVIAKAIGLQRRLRFHSESNPFVFGQYASEAVTEYLKWVESLLPPDKYRVFVQLFRSPVKSAALTAKIYRELALLFNSRNASETFQFSDPTYLGDWMEYRKRVLHEPEVWQEDGWKHYKLSPNSVLIVDLPQKQSTSLPEPYFYWLPIEEVIDYETVDGTQMAWIAYRQDGDKIAVIDGFSYRMYDVSGDKPKLIGEPREHGLNYCPARFFLKQSCSVDEPCLKENALVPALDSLDWYVFFSISKRHLDTYAAYPIYSAYRADCDFENNETGEYCDGGFLRDSDGNYKMMADGTIAICPKCGQRRLAGAGSFIEVPVPNQMEGVSDLREPVSITQVDEKGLKYNDEECKKLAGEIFDDVVGSNIDEDVQSKEAINETQVASNFKSRSAVLTIIKTELEEAKRFVDDTVCRLRYDGAFISSSISMGTEFYLQTSQELYDKYNKAKNAGASSSELTAISNQIFEVEHGNNRDTLRRVTMLRQIEPYQHRTVNDIIQLNSSGMLDVRDVELKLNFDRYVDRFERENGNILNYKRDLPMAKRIDDIQQIIRGYVDDAMKDRIVSEPKKQEVSPKNTNNNGEQGNND